MSGTIEGNSSRSSGSIAAKGSGITTSSGDPTISTNPSELGTMFVNTTSGETYVCSDITEGANVWQNIGDGTGDIKYTFGGESFGYSQGGLGPASDVIDKFSFTAQADATDVGNLTIAGGGHCPNKSATHGYASGGDTLLANINKYSFSSDGNAVDAGFDLSSRRYLAAGASSATHGLSIGGQSGDGSDVLVDILDKFAFAAASDATDIGNLTVTRERNAGHSSTTFGYSSGGTGGGATDPMSDVIDKASFSSEGNMTDVGNLTDARGPSQSGASSPTHG